MFLSLYASEPFDIKLPVNHNLHANTHIDLSIQIPPGWKCVQNIGESIRLREFIPPDEAAENWTKIITLNVFRNENMTARRYIDIFKHLALTCAYPVQILKEEKLALENYEKGILAYAYVRDGVQHICRCVYYSGPSDLSGMQYDKTVREGQNVREALTVIEDFMDSSSTIIQG